MKNLPNSIQTRDCGKVGSLETPNSKARRSSKEESNLLACITIAQAVLSVFFFIFIYHPHLPFLSHNCYVAYLLFALKIIKEKRGRKNVVTNKAKENARPYTVHCVFKGSHIFVLFLNHHPRERLLSCYKAFYS